MMSEDYPCDEDEDDFHEWADALDSDADVEAKLVITDRTRIVLQKNNTDELSPFATVNS
jgi:hypothetical protein